MILPISIISYIRLDIPYLKECAFYLGTIDKFFHSTIFTIFLFLCHYGSQDIITKFLSLRFWVPLDRLGLSFLISNVLIFRWALLMRKEPLDFNLYTMVSLTFYKLKFSDINSSIFHPRVNIISIK